VILPEEEVKIKEIEEIVEESVPVDEGASSVKKAKAKIAQDQTKSRKKG
jgi:hypothetical protein